MTRGFSKMEVRFVPLIITATLACGDAVRTGVWCVRPLQGQRAAPRLACRRAGQLSCLEEQPPNMDSTIDELLAESRPEALPSLMGRRMHILADARFLARLQAREYRAAGTVEMAQIAQVRELVISFLEEVTTQMQLLEPELSATQAEADAIAAATAKQAAEARSKPKRRTSVVQPAGPTTAAGQATEGEADAAFRETRARNRYLVERLLVRVR